MSSTVLFGIIAASGLALIITLRARYGLVGILIGAALLLIGAYGLLTSLATSVIV